MVFVDLFGPELCDTVCESVLNVLHLHLEIQNLVNQLVLELLVANRKFLFVFRFDELRKLWGFALLSKLLLNVST